MCPLMGEIFLCCVLSSGSVGKALPDEVHPSCLVYSVILPLYRLFITLMALNMFSSIENNSDFRWGS